ncbi:MAG TPA: styrene monooxygenase/indole monooxygenase family protein [Pseudonocardiaceae bacterium]|nr:styrene monooxygenase/indole monooxygenase family protein [Pseudonocardiaceae bacterium]
MMAAGVGSGRGGSRNGFARGPLALIRPRRGAIAPHPAAGEPVQGMWPRPQHPDVNAVRMNVVPGLGELFVSPAYITAGRPR